MYLTGFADEAAPDLAGQIRATKELGWRNIESRAIDGTNIHDLSDDDFDKACAQLEEAGIEINCFGSTITNWAKQVNEPFDTSLEEARRAIPRMKRLGTKLVRVMSFAVLEDREPDDQMEEERFRRLRELQKMFSDEGLTMVHENCMNYGGMSWSHTLRMIENVPGLKLVFDTGNPVTLPDRSKPKPWLRQSSWEFYTNVKEHVAYIHIKDAIWDEAKQNATFTYPGEGQGDVRRIMADAIAGGYDGGVSIEPHLAVVFHDPTVKADPDKMRNSYVEYGRRMEAIVAEARQSAGQ
jgi:sugar phosphate isomerase/epimerase